jgi:hypothetical protein
MPTEKQGVEDEWVYYNARPSLRRAYAPIEEDHLMKLLNLVAVLLFASLPAFADSIQIDSFRPGTNGEPVSFTLVPGVDQLVLGTRYGSESFLNFLETFTGSGAFTWTLSLADLQQPLVFNFQLACHPGDTCGAGSGFFVPTTYTPVAGQLRVQFNDETAVFNLQYVSNAPEPTTLLLLSTGLGGIAWRKRRQRQRSI